MIPPTARPPTSSQPSTGEPAIGVTTQASTTAAPPPPVTVTVSPITFSGTVTAGKTFRLICAVTVTGSTDLSAIIILWLMGPMDNMITSGVETTGGMSTLTFNPLSASHAGTYTCRATLGSAMDSASTTVTVQSE